MAGRSVKLGGMTLTLVGSLVLLALIDSTSFGTLLIPIWLMLAPERPSARRLLLFLGTVAVFYFLVGALLLAGAHAWSEQIASALDTPAAAWIQLALGVGLFALSFRLGKKRDGEPGRLTRWRDTAAAGTGRARSLVLLALTAATLEVATMLPYLGAIGLLTTSDLATGTSLLILAGYCVVMILPALVLLVGRIVAARAVEPLLRRVSTWMETKGGEATAWIVGIVGFLVARDALVRTGLLDRFVG